jgi:hypothetical protein
VTLEQILATLNDNTAKYHPGLDCFALEMQTRFYGSEALDNAWAWFKAGWKGAACEY